ncbi:MAG: TlpA disulfide reductase family protein [Crocinitomicaceae bacterium]|nr:TlpA disulfide reductase family protein [Crocinitomicaceae bacterium]
MITKLAGLFFSLGVLISCSEEVKPLEDENRSEELITNIEISGAIKNNGNNGVFLEARSPNGIISIAETTSDASGNFLLNGNIPAFGLYQLRLGDNTQNTIPLTLVPNDKLNIEANIENYTSSPILSGTSWSRVMTDYMKLYSDFQIAQAALMADKGNKTNEELTQNYQQLKALVDSFAIAQMLADPGNPFNVVLISAASPEMGFNDWNPDNLDVLNTVCNAYMKSFPNSPMTNSLSEHVFQIETNYKQHIANTSGTFAAPEIKLNNPDGVELSLSGLKGKYVLIDFWASWCGPCRRENPNVVRLYNTYKNKGFTIFSVSLDDNAEAWKEAIKKDGLTWPNHVSDLLKWNSPLPQLYGFSGIPHTVLLNKEGNIIGVGLRGEKLEQKLKEIFSK